MATGLCSSVLVVAAVSNCSAGFVSTLNYDDQSAVLSGTTPGSTGVYATAAFERLSDTQVQAVFSVPSNTVSGLYLDQVGFQFNATGVAFARVSGQEATTSFNGTNGIAVVGTGNEKYNTWFDFPRSNADRVKFGQSSTYTLTFAGVTLASDLSNSFTTPTYLGNDFTYFSAAHIAGYRDSAGIAPSGPGTGPIPPYVVPEPASVCLLLAGLACTGFGGKFLRRRKLDNATHTLVLTLKGAPRRCDLPQLRSAASCKTSLSD